MNATTTTAATINILLGVVALTVSRRIEVARSAEAVPEFSHGPLSQEKARTFEREVSPRQVATVIGGFAVSGFIALSYEVIWSRVLALIIGSSVYAFSIMLTTFLTGLAAGAALVSRFADRIRRPVMAFAVIEIGVGITSFIGAHLFNDLPYV